MGCALDVVCFLAELVWYGVVDLVVGAVVDGVCWVGDRGNGGSFRGRRRARQARRQARRTGPPPQPIGPPDFGGTQ